MAGLPVLECTVQELFPMCEIQMDDRWYWLSRIENSQYTRTLITQEVGGDGVDVAFVNLPRPLVIKYRFRTGRAAHKDEAQKDRSGYRAKKIPVHGEDAVIIEDLMPVFVEKNVYDPRQWKQS